MREFWRELARGRVVRDPSLTGYLTGRIAGQFLAVQQHRATPSWGAWSWSSTQPGA